MESSRKEKRIININKGEDCIDNKKIKNSSKN